MKLLRILSRLFRRGVCDHKWEIINEVKVQGERKDDMGQYVIYAVVYILQCEHCGNIKKKRISI